MEKRLWVVLVASIALQTGHASHQPLGEAPALAETHADSRAGPSLDVLAWNLFLRPRKLFKDRQLDRASLMPKFLSSFEVLVLSEAFDDGLRRQLTAALKPSHPYVSQVVGRDEGYKQDGGVFVLSRWPIEAQDVALYGDLCEGADCLAEKGVLYVRIVKEHIRYHLFATHLQAANPKVRAEQLQMLSEFIASKKIPVSEPVIIAGDFNIKRHSGEFSRMLAILGATCPPTSGYPYTSDPGNELVRDSKRATFLDYVLYSDSHLKPVKSKLETQIFRANGGINLSDHYAVLGRMAFALAHH